MKNDSRQGFKLLGFAQVANSKDIFPIKKTDTLIVDMYMSLATRLKNNMYIIIL